MKLLAVLMGLAAACIANASPPVDWIPGATAEYVDEPVFGGRVALYRAGPRNAASVRTLSTVARQPPR